MPEPKVLYTERTRIEHSRNVGDSDNVRTTLYALDLPEIAYPQTMHLLVIDHMGPFAEEWERDHQSILPASTDAAAIRKAIEAHDQLVAIQQYMANHPDVKAEYFTEGEHDVRG